MKIPKLLSKAFMIDIDIYHTNLYIIVGDIKQLKTLINLKYPNPTKENLK